MSETEMITCDEVLAQLWEYIDGELTSERTEQIRMHLEACSRCFPQYDFRRAFVAFLRRQKQQPAPPELRRRIFRELLRESQNGAG